MVIEIVCKFFINIINNVFGNLGAFWLVLEEEEVLLLKSLECRKGVRA